jgi:hypothetical protein
MLGRVMGAVPLAALLAIAVPQAEAMGVPSLQSHDALVFVGRDGDRRDGRESRRHHRRDNRDRWFGFGRPYVFDRYRDCGWLRRRAVETDSSHWWRRYRECRAR